MSKLCLLRVVDRWTGMLEQATWDVLEEEDRLIQKINDICMCCAWDFRHTGIKNCWLNRLIVKTWWCWPLYFLFTRMESYLLEPSFKNHFTDCYQNPISLLLTASPFSPSWLEEQGPVLFFFVLFAQPSFGFSTFLHMLLCCQRNLQVTYVSASFTVCCSCWRNQICLYLSSTAQG